MFKAILQFFSQLFKSPQFQKFEAFCGKVFVAEKALLIGSISDFAMQAVRVAASTDLNASDKRLQAYNTIVAQAQTAGIAVASSMIYTAIEMAYQALQNESGNKGAVDGSKSG